MCILSTMPRLGFGSKNLVGLVKAGIGMEAFLRDAKLIMIFIVALHLPWCRHVESFREDKASVKC